MCQNSKPGSTSKIMDSKGVNMIVKECLKDYHKSVTCLYNKCETIYMFIICFK